MSLNKHRPVTLHSQNLKVLTIFELGIFFPEDPREHLPRLHARSDDASRFVPMGGGGFPSPFCWILLLLEADLVEYTHKEFVYVVVDAYGNLYELWFVGAGQALAVCWWKKNRFKLFNFFCDDLEQENSTPRWSYPYNPRDWFPEWRGWWVLETFINEINKDILFYPITWCWPTLVSHLEFF